MEKIKKVLFVIAFNNFRDEEYLEPKKILTESGYTVVTASTELGEARGKLGCAAEVDILFSEIKIKEYDAIVFIGGSGIVSLWDDERLHEIATIFHDEEKIVAAICSAPVILARAGLLKGKKATSFINDEKWMKEKGAVYTGNQVEIDENIVTANGHEAAKEFAKTLIAMMA